MLYWPYQVCSLGSPSCPLSFAEIDTRQGYYVFRQSGYQLAPPYGQLNREFRITRPASTKQVPSTSIHLNTTQLFSIYDSIVVRVHGYFAEICRMRRVLLATTQSHNFEGWTFIHCTCFFVLFSRNRRPRDNNQAV
jgi:hypothetical protein